MSIVENGFTVSNRNICVCGQTVKSAPTTENKWILNLISTLRMCIRVLVRVRSRARVCVCAMQKCILFSVRQIYYTIMHFMWKTNCQEFKRNETWEREGANKHEHMLGDLLTTATGCFRCTLFDGLRKAVCMCLQQDIHSKRHYHGMFETCCDSSKSNNKHFYYGDWIVTFRINESINIFACITRQIFESEWNGYTEGWQGRENYREIVTDTDMKSGDGQKTNHLQCKSQMFIVKPLDVTWPKS